MLRVDRFPLSSKYDPQWVLENEMGPNVLWLTEWLCEAMDLRPGMRLLDMGCGKAISSIFLAKEFGVQVWATDLWIDATDNWKRIREAGVADCVFPIHAEAHVLPYANGFFDAIVSLDSYHYYGTDDLYLSDYFVRLVKPGGQIGIVVPGLMRHFEAGVPEHLEKWWDYGRMFSFHTVEWWRRHWEQTKIVDIECADILPDGWRYWLLFRESQRESQQIAESPPGGGSESAALRADQGRYLGFVRMVARKRFSMVTIRPEKTEDHASIHEMHRLAFGKENEARLVEAIRQSANFIPELSLVAVKNGQVVGHILFSLISIETQKGSVSALALAPIAVRPEFQRQGIGAELIRHGLKECKRLGHKVVVVIGGYARWGFSSARAKGLEVPFPVSDDRFEVLELIPGALDGISGMVKYPPAFNEV